MGDQGTIGTRKFLRLAEKMTLVNKVLEHLDFRLVSSLVNLRH